MSENNYDSCAVIPSTNCNNIAFSLASEYNITVLQDSIRILQTQGYKATKPRRLVLDVLEKTEKPLSPYDIQDVLHTRGKYLNHVTIYRILSLLCSLKRIRSVLLRVFLPCRYVAHKTAPRHCGTCAPGCGSDHWLRRQRCVSGWIY